MPDESKLTGSFNLHVVCKGKGFCGRPVCPILRRFEEIAALPKIGQCIEGFSPPEVFVGRQGYPLVRAGPLMPAGDIESVPKSLLGLDVGEIVALRSSMIRSEARIEVKEAASPGKLLESCQQLAMSSEPVGAEISFLKPPIGRLQFDGVMMPSGPSGSLKDMSLTTNPAIPRKVDSFVQDKDSSAISAVGELYSSGIEIEHISRLLSLGLLGHERKLVPTRWSITASDDMIGKVLIESLADLPISQDYQLYSGEELGNHFEILLVPAIYSFELVEIWMPGSVWSPEGWIGSDSEGQRGKNGYSPLAGGYYAARLAALEHMAGIGRQASVLAVREISERYWAPLGVWVVREAARKAFRESPKRFSALSEALNEMASRMKTPFKEWKAVSKLASGSIQASLADFLMH